jgi:hypothetical protein
VIRFESSTETDLEQIAVWQALDDSKSPNLPPQYWFTGTPGCIFACRVDDAESTVLYLRCEPEGGLVRFHTLFAPPDVVPQKRVALTLLEGFPKLVEHMKSYGKGMVIETRSESLARFMVDKFRFARVEGTDDYRMDFSVDSQINEAEVVAEHFNGTVEE